MATEQKSLEAKLIEKYAAEFTASFDWVDHLKFLASEIKNDAFQVLLPFDPASMSDASAATGDAYCAAGNGSPE